MPTPRPGVPAPAGRLRPRSGAAQTAPAQAPKKRSSGKGGIITAIVVIVALAAGIAIGGTVFNLI
ncbi:MAG: hypothetical protein AAF726_15135 [Planctomycetota bacterium]